MRLEWIEDILAVLDGGSFARAAEKRFLTQSAFTRRLRTIEVALGVELFDRTRKPAGLLPHVRGCEQDMRILAMHLRSLSSKLKDQDEISGKRIVLACQHAVATTVAPRLIRQINDAGQVIVRVQSSSKDKCLSMLLKSEADFVLTYESDSEADKSAALPFERSVLGHDRIVPVLSPENGQHLLDDIRRDVLPMVTYPTDIFLGEIMSEFILPTLTRDFHIVERAETQLAQEVMQYCLEGIGVGWVPEALVAPYLEQNKLIILDDLLPVGAMHLVLLRREDATASKNDYVWKLIGSTDQKLRDNIGGNPARNT